MGCSKSEIHDSSYGSQEIGFETYVGREAQSKAPSYGSESLPSAVGVYGFYSGAGTWDETDSPNLWTNLQLTSGSGTWTYNQNQKRYWTNDKDNYTFLAYAPYATGTGETDNGLVASTGADPTVTYTVPADLPRQVDLLYSNNNLNTTKAKCTSGTGANAKTEVTLNMQHALSRLSIKANAVMYDKTGAEVTTPVENQVYDHIFTITGISIKGKFITNGSLRLSDGSWSLTNPTAETTYDLTGTVSQALDADLHDFSADNNYLTIIPVEFTTTNPAVLEVTYTISFAGVTSDPINKSVDITADFEQGKAYSINLTFQRENNNPISFVVEQVESWTDGSTING